MTIGPNRVQVLKQESAANGGDAADESVQDRPIEPLEDALECAGFYLQAPSETRNQTVGGYRDGGEFYLFDQKLTAGVRLRLIAGYSTLIFRPSGTLGGNVVTTWAAVAAIIAALDGECILLIDDSLATATANSNVDGKGKLQIHGLRRQAITQPILTIADGTTLSDVHWIRWCKIKASPTNAAAPALKCTLTQATLTFDDSSSLELQAAATVKAIQFTVPGGLRLFQNASLSTLAGGTIPIVLVDANINLIMRVVDGPSSGSAMPTNAIACAAGTGALSIITDGSADRAAQTLWVGSGLQSNTRFHRAINTEPSATTTAARPTELRPGQMNFDTDIGMPMWWDGSAWTPPRETPTEITSTSSTGITATSDTLVSGMTSTPGAGTYDVEISGSVTAQNSRSLTMSMYAGGSQVTATERTTKGDIGSLSGDANGAFQARRRVTVTAGQAIEMRGRVSGGATSTIQHRVLIIERVA